MSHYLRFLIEVNVFLYICRIINHIKNCTGKLTCRSRNVILIVVVVDFLLNILLPNKYSKNAVDEF